MQELLLDKPCRREVFSNYFDDEGNFNEGGTAVGFHGYYRGA
jgi:hypothetical protein